MDRFCEQMEMIARKGSSAQRLSSVAAVYDRRRLGFRR
jgi:hypothetical protein